MVLRNRLPLDRSSLPFDPGSLRPDGDALDQLAGLTGLGWTASVLGFAATLVGYGNALVLKLVSDPTSLLYAGVVLFLATLGLDRLAGLADD